MTKADDWSRCKPLIEAALATSPGLESIEDIEQMVLDGKQHFWASKNSAAITEFATYSQRKALVVIHGGGDLGELLNELEPAMCAFARSNGCDIIMGTGRKGWEKVTEKRGYRFGFVTMCKDLSN